MYNVREKTKFYEYTIANSKTCNNNIRIET